MIWEINLTGSVNCQISRNNYSIKIINLIKIMISSWIHKDKQIKRVINYIQLITPLWGLKVMKLIICLLPRDKELSKLRKTKMLLMLPIINGESVLSWKIWRKIQCYKLIITSQVSWNLIIWRSVRDHRICSLVEWKLMMILNISYKEKHRW